MPLYFQTNPLSAYVGPKQFLFNLRSTLQVYQQKSEQKKCVRWDRVQTIGDELKLALNLPRTTSLSEAAQQIRWYDMSKARQCNHLLNAVTDYERSRYKATIAGSLLDKIPEPDTRELEGTTLEIEKLMSDLYFHLRAARNECKNLEIGEHSGLTRVIVGAKDLLKDVYGRGRLIELQSDQSRTNSSSSEGSGRPLVKQR